MRWKKRGSKKPYIDDCIFAQEIICEAFYEGFISWKIYKKALEKIESNTRGSWMFEQDKEKMYIIDWGKPYGGNDDAESI